MTTALERLTSLAAALVDAPMAAIVRVVPGQVDIVAGHQVPALAYAVDIDEKAAGFVAGQTGIVCDTAKNAYFATHPMVVGAPFLGALIRLPIKVAGRLSLVIGFRERLNSLIRIAFVPCLLWLILQRASTNSVRFMIPKFPKPPSRSTS
jgi:hypothetical protein